MKKYLLLFLLAGVLGLSSCIKDPVDPYKQAEEQLAKDEVIIKKFIADNNIPALRDASGVYYQIIEPGSGSVNYTANTKITVQYKGKLLNGTVFDFSKDNQPFVFNLGDRIINGWKIGVPLIQKGGKIRLIIPSGYAYGSQAPGSIPGNSILDFDIEIVDIQ
ncbi:MAG: FKBP-type peptidyl-prolyl cis-trans isomerase [Pelobium sp.]